MCHECRCGQLHGPGEQFSRECDQHGGDPDGEPGSGGSKHHDPAGEPDGYRRSEREPSNVVATGTTPLSYQWLKGTASITGATSATLALSGVTTADAGSYTVRVSNSAGSATSSGGDTDGESRQWWRQHHDPAGEPDGYRGSQCEL